MAETKKILIIGRHEDMLQRAIKLLRENEYTAIGHTRDEDALMEFQRTPFDGVVIGGGVEFASRQLFEIEFPKMNSRVKVLSAHPNTLLDELSTAFKNSM